MNVAKGQKRTKFKKFQTLRFALEWVIQQGQRRSRPVVAGSSGDSDSGDLDQLTSAITMRVKELNITAKTSGNMPAASTSLPSASASGDAGPAAQLIATGKPDGGSRLMGNAQSSVRLRLQHEERDLKPQSTGSMESPADPGACRQ